VEVPAESTGRDAQPTTSSPQESTSPKAFARPRSAQRVLLFRRSVRYKAAIRNARMSAAACRGDIRCVPLKAEMMVRGRIEPGSRLARATYGNDHAAWKWSRDEEAQT
jgi:hypothetical protein